jgi:integrase
MALKPLKVFKRGAYFYYQYLLENDVYSTPKSTGIGIDKPRNEAMQAAQKLIDNGEHIKKAKVTDEMMIKQIRFYLESNDIITKEETISNTDLLDKLSQKINGISLTVNNPPFLDYLREFWDYDKSPYIQSLKDSGQDIGLAYCKGNMQMMNKHIVPYFADKKYRLKDITTKILEDFKMTLPPEPSGSTKNRVLSIIKVAMGESLRLGLTNYSIKPRNFKLNPKKRGILTAEEMTKLFEIEWENKRCKVGCLLSIMTGMRAGEVIALRLEDIDIEKNYLNIRHSWDNRTHCLKSPKNGKSRIVPLDEDGKMLAMLLELHEENPHTDKEFIFYGKKKNAPMYRDLLRKELIKSLEKIGILEEEREERNIVFHSTRHYHNSHMRGEEEFNDELLRKGMGHSSEEMTDNYYHVTSEELERMREVQKKRIISNLPL